jgi:hypothetical protein
MLLDCANISVVLVLNAVDVLPQMLTSHQPAIVPSPPSPNTKGNSLFYLRFEKNSILNVN